MHISNNLGSTDHQTTLVSLALFPTLFSESVHENFFVGS